MEIKKTSNHQQGEHEKFLMKSAVMAATFSAILILIAKIYGYIITDSMTILAMLIDSMLDIFSSIVNFIALSLALSPPDNNHRFGKNKIEDLAVFAQSMFFFGLGFFMIFSAIRRWITVQPVVEVDTGIYVMMFSMTLTGILVLYQLYVVRKTKARIVQADSLHYTTDFVSNLGAIISLYLSERWNFIDPLFSLLIAFYIFYGSYKLAVSSWKNLIDHEFSEEDKKKIFDLLSKYNDKIHGIHELKTRQAGSKYFIQFHLELPGDISLHDAHEISDEIMYEIEKLFPSAEVIIHQDPEGLEHNVNYREQI